MMLPPSPSPTAQANRRRRFVFGAVLALALLASLTYVFQRPAQYLATARWQFVFPERDDPASAATTQGGTPMFLTELQVITSRPLLEKLHAELKARGLVVPASNADPIDALQRSIQVRPVPGTTIVEVRADGLLAEPLPAAINTLFDIYRRQLDANHQARAGDDHLKARDEANALAARISQRRAAVNAFRERHHIVSAERDENQVLAQFKGQSASLNLANEKLVTAEAKLRSLRESAAAGKTVARVRDNPMLANLEQRYSQAREELRAMERGYTEAYMTRDPNAKALRVRVANLEDQLAQARQAAQQVAAADAEEELSTARSAADRVAQQMGSARQSVQTFSARMAEYKSMQDDLDRLEKMHGAATARATALEAGSRRSAPAVHLLEPAGTPQEPWLPNYRRDALVAVAGSLVLALLALGLVELLNRPEAQPTTPMPPPPGWDDVDTRPWVQRSLGRGAAAFALPQAPAPVRLLEANTMPRELDDDELGALLEAAAPHTLPVLVALLSGLQVDELVALNWGDVDPSVPALRLPGRSLALTGPLLDLLARPAGDVGTPDAPLLADPHARRLSAADIDASVVVAAHDAGLARAAEVDAAALRHTYVAHLVRQGARFADLSHWAGKLPLASLAPYGSMAPAGPKRVAEEIDPVLPALRRWV